MRILFPVSRPPLFAPEGEVGSQPELALEVEPQKDDFAAKLEDAAKVSQDDPNDLNHSEADEKTEEPAKEEPVKAEVKEEKEEPELSVEELKAELEAERKARRAITKRLGSVSAEKRDLSAKLQENIKAVPKEEPVAEDGEQLQRSDYKTKAEFDLAVQAEAERRLAVQEFNSKCNAVETAGSKAFGDKWAKAKTDLAMLDDMGRIPLDLLSVALETDDPAKVLFELGNDIEMATEMMGMTPIKRAIAMDKLAAKKAPARSQSKAPPPVDPIGGRGATDDRPRDTDSDEEWNRKEEIRERKVAEEKRRRLGY